MLVAITCSLAIEAGDEAFQTWSRIATAALVAIGAAWTGTLLNALGRVTRAQRWAITVMGLVAAALLATFTLDFQHRAEGWRALLLIAATSAWLVAVPALAAQPAQRSLMLRRVNGRFLVRALGAGLYAGALFLGLALALAAIDTLFELDLREEIFAHVFAWLMLGLVPWITFGGLPDYVRPLDEVSSITSGVHRLTRFLVPPLLAIYYAILYAYAVRIAMVGELPKNLVSPMVLAAGMLAAAAMLLFDPEHDDRAGLAALRFAPPLFLPLAVLGFWGLWPRIAQYGWTEFRVARLTLMIALTLLALAGTVLVLRRRRFPLHTMMLALALTLAVSALGPLSALAVSRRSQLSQLNAALADAGLPTALAEAQTTGVKRSVPAATYERINSIARFLSTHFGASALEPILPAEARTSSALTDLSAHLGLVRALVAGQKTPFSGNLAADAFMQLENAQMARRIMYPMGNPDTLLSVRPDSTGLLFTIGQETFRAALDQVLEGMTTMSGPPTMRPENAAVPVLDSARVRRGTLIVFSINGDRELGKIHVSHLDGLLLLDSRNDRR